MVVSTQHTIYEAVPTAQTCSCTQHTTCGAAVPTAQSNTHGIIGQCSQHMAVYRMQYRQQCPWHKPAKLTGHSSTLYTTYEVEVLMTQHMQEYTT